MSPYQSDAAEVVIGARGVKTPWCSRRLY